MAGTWINPRPALEKQKSGLQAEGVRKILAHLVEVAPGKPVADKGC